MILSVFLSDDPFWVNIQDIQLKCNGILVNCQWNHFQSVIHIRLSCTDILSFFMENICSSSTWLMTNHPVFCINTLLHLCIFKCILHLLCLNGIKSFTRIPYMYIYTKVHTIFVCKWFLTQRSDAIWYQRFFFLRHLLYNTYCIYR